MYYRPSDKNVNKIYNEIASKVNIYPISACDKYLVGFLLTLSFNQHIFI